MPCRSNRYDREYVNSELNECYAARGIVHQTTVAYNPEQNGAAETRRFWSGSRHVDGRRAPLCALGKDGAGRNLQPTCAHSLRERPVSALSCAVLFWVVRHSGLMHNPTG